MARNFSNDGIDLGNIAAAQFLESASWSLLAFARFENLTADERAVVAKWGSAGTRQFELNTNKTPAHHMEVRNNGATAITGSGAALVVDTWYLFVVTFDTSTATLYTLKTDGSVVDTDTGSWNDDPDVTEEVRIGEKQGGGDDMDGDIAHVAYIDAVLTLQDIKEYLYSPARVVARFIGSDSVQFYLPLGLGSPEPDFSGKGNNGTVSGTAISDNPPTGPLFGFDLGWQGAAAAAAAATTSFPPVQPWINRSPHLRM